MLDFETTAWIVGGAIAVLIAANLAARKAGPLTRLAYVPWTAIQFVALIMVFVFGAHLYSEWRGEPLQPLRGPQRALQQGR